MRQRAVMKGSLRYPELNGVIRLYQTGCGVTVAAEISGLPVEEKVCGNSGEMIACGEIQSSGR